MVGYRVTLDVRDLQVAVTLVPPPALASLQAALSQAGPTLSWDAVQTALGGFGVQLITSHFENSKEEKSSNNSLEGEQPQKTTGRGTKVGEWQSNCGCGGESKGISVEDDPGGAVQGSGMGEA